MFNSKTFMNLAASLLLMAAFLFCCVMSTVLMTPQTQENLT